MHDIGKQATQPVPKCILSMNGIQNVWMNGNIPWLYQPNWGDLKNVCKYIV